MLILPFIFRLLSPASPPQVNRSLAGSLASPPFETPPRYVRINPRSSSNPRRMREGMDPPHGGSVIAITKIVKTPQMYYALYTFSFLGQFSRIIPLPVPPCVSSQSSQRVTRTQ